MITQARYLRKVLGHRALALAALHKLHLAPGRFEVRHPLAAHPFEVRLLSSDVDTCEQIFHDEEYAFSARHAPEIILDAGANIGLASIYFATKFPRARIFALEPEAENFALLKQNLAPYPNVTPIFAALWSEVTTITLSDPGLGSWGFVTHGPETRGVTGPAKHEVEALTVDEIMHRHALSRIDLLKVDIEGAEREVFRDASRWIDEVGAIVAELHDRMKPGCARAFYAATVGFEHDWKRGENVFMARRGSCLIPPSGGSG